MESSFRASSEFENRSRRVNLPIISHTLPYQAQCIDRPQLSWGKLRGKPATRWFDESFAPILRSGGNDLHVSSAQRKLPPSFHLASPCPSIVHHLSGLNKNVQGSISPLARPKAHALRRACVRNGPVMQQASKGQRLISCFRYAVRM